MKATTFASFFAICWTGILTAQESPYVGYEGREIKALSNDQVPVTEETVAATDAMDSFA